MGPSVLVVGAGPTGLTLAGELAGRGITVTLIEGLTEPAPHSRALVVHSRTQELLQRSGLRDALAENAIEIRGMAFRHGSRTLSTIPFDVGRYPALSLPQVATERVLARQFVAGGGAIERGRTLTAITQTAAGVEAVAEGERFTADFLVGCDGARSTVRHLLGIPFEGHSVPETVWMADAHLTWDLTPDHVWQFLHRSGSLTVVPIPGGRWRLVTSHADCAQQQVSADYFVGAVAQRAGIAFGDLDITWTSEFRVNCRLAASYGRGRVLLAGDAAHIHSPIGGQGMNVGMQDAFRLAADLTNDPNQTPLNLLNRYQAARRPIAASVIRTNARITRLAMARTPVKRLLRDHVIPSIFSLPPVARKAGLAASASFDH